MYKEGMVFEENYPPEVAEWCNESGTHHIEEIEPDGDVRRFKIVANNAWVPTAEESIGILQAKLKATDYISAKAVDALANCNSIGDIMNVILTVKEKYGDVLAERAKWREEINALEGGDKS